MERLLEREGELETLDTAVAQAVDGRGTLALIGGEAGVGKTSLVRALHERVTDRASFLASGCESLSVPVPLGPIRELFDAATGDDGRELEAEDRLLIARQTLDALRSGGPAVAVIEDAHWADPMTLDIVRLLARRIEDSAVVLIVTYRNDELATNADLRLLVGDLATTPTVRRIELHPLSAAAIRELARPAGLDAGALAHLTGGNPFLVVESIAASGTLPASVRDAALARAGRLSEAAREVVDVAAVVGQRFTPALLAQLIAASGDAVDEALARGVLVADGTRLGFRHELIREAIEEAIPVVRRARLHADVVTALEAQPDPVEPARLAHHAELGGRTSVACRYAIAAAAEAERVGALRETHLQAERALRLGTDLTPAERFDVLVQYVRAANFSSTNLGEVAAAGERAVALARELGDRRREGQALVVLAWALWSADQLPEARAAAEAAAAALDPTGDVAWMARARSTLVRMEAAAFDPRAAVAAGPDALALAEDAGLRETAIEITISVALALGHLGDERAIAMLRAAQEEARASGYSIQIVRSYVNLMYVAAALRDHAAAEQIADDAVNAFEEMHAPIPALAIQGFLARSKLDRGEFSAAWAAAVRSEAVWHAEVPGARLTRALISARTGRDGAEALLDAAWREIEAVPEGSRHALAFVARVELAWLRGDHAGAEQALRTALDAPATLCFARAASELAVWARRYGMTTPCPESASRAIRCELAGDWRGAIRAWQELDAPYEAALAALPGDDRAARDALAGLHRIGAHAAAAAFTRERVAAGLRSSRGPRRSTLANVAGLTVREQEILELLSTGATNGAIATRLHLSERTVAHHVSAVLAKLGVSNRLAAVDRARRLELLGQDRPTADQT